MEISPLQHGVNEGLFDSKQATLDSELEHMKIVSFLITGFCPVSALL